MSYDNSDGRLRGRKLQAARLRIWSADPHCAMCRKLCAFPHGFELDHKQALHKAAEGDDVNDDDNLQVLCVEWPSPGVKAGCHVTKTAQDMGFKPRAQFDAQGRVAW